MLKARQMLGKYRIDRRLAEGPLSVVYAAYDTIQRIPVALKTPAAGAASDYYLQDFRREAALAPKLQHRNILPIRDASIIEGTFVIIMPLGVESLAQRLRRRLASKTALEFAEQALAATAMAHAARVVHCDIKPSNFVIFPENELRLTDFAISKRARPVLKASGSGTVGYIAPEQAMGRPMYQSDVFSLGLVIYEMLTGHLPEWPYQWPPEGMQRLREKVSGKYINWLRKALDPDPRRRYRDATVMQREFARLGRVRPPARRRGAGKRRPADPRAWQQVLFRQFQRKYRAALDTRHHCHECTGPVAELMSGCPWCGATLRARQMETRFPAECPRCSRGVKADWPYCAWCYGARFEVETARHYPDKRYTHQCEHAECRGPLMAFMRYCPWCRRKVRRAWKLADSQARCDGCGWGVDPDYWHHCPWCTRALE